MPILLATLVALLAAPEAAAPAAPYKPGAKATVLLFLATECPVANAMAPEIAALQQEFAAQGVAFYRVYCGSDADAEAIARHGEDYALAFPAILDADYTLARAHEAEVTPEAVVLDAQGKRVYRGRISNLYEDFGRKRQVVTAHELRDALAAVIAGQSVATPETRAVGCYIDYPELPGEPGQNDTP